MRFGFLFYYLNIICLVFYRCVFSGKKGKKAFLFTSCFHLFIILAIRSIYTGVDVRTQYPSVFRSANQLSFGELISKWSFLSQMRLSWTTESGYAMLNWIFGSLLGMPFRALLVFLSFLNAFAIYKYLKRNSASPFLGTVIVYVLMMEMLIHLLRRATAMSLFMLALLQVEDRHYKRGWALMFLAFTMHRTSIIMFIFPLLSRIKITRKIVLQIIAFICALALVARPLATTLIPQILSFFDKAAYLHTNTWQNPIKGYNTTIKYVYVCVCMFILVGIYLFINFEIFATPENNMLFWIFLFFVATLPIDLILPMLTIGVPVYFRVPTFLLFANIISQRRGNRYVKVFLWLMLFLVLVYIQTRYVIFMLYPNIDPSGGGGYMLEYKTMFQTLSGQ